MPGFLTARLIHLAIFFAAVGMMSFGYYLQYAQGLEPCPLCMTQRVFIVATGITALLAALHNPATLGTRVYAGFALLFTVVGGGFSIRHIYLQSLPPDQAPACGPSIDYILDAFPLMDALEILLRGDGNCAEVVWTFLGGTIPQWTLVAFIGFAVALILNLARPTRP